MPDKHQLGSDEDWLKHSNDELARIVKKRDRQILLLRYSIILLAIALAWVTYKYSAKGSLAELWRL